MNWTLETLDEEVDKELDALPEDMQARFMHIGRLLERNGPMNVREPHAKPLFKNCSKCDFVAGTVFQGQFTQPLPASELWFCAFLQKRHKNSQERNRTGIAKSKGA